MDRITRYLVSSVLVLLSTSPAIGVSTAHSDSMSPLVALQAVVQLARFRSVELRNGGKVILRHAPVQQVTLLKGSLNYTHVTIASGDRLVIDKCRIKCPPGYKLEVEIAAPDIAGISIADGGTIEVRGPFPRRNEIKAAVSQGGVIDIRQMTVDSVTASIEQGGTILTKPHSVLIASVLQGGNITYWGEARVISSDQHGGAVTKGPAEAANKPLWVFGASFSSVPPIPGSPIQPVRNLF